MSDRRPDAQMTDVLSGQWAGVAVVTRDDVLALRLTLLCAHVRRDVPLWVTVFDRTLIHQLHEEVPSVNIVSSAELVARELADHCSAITAPALAGVMVFAWSTEPCGCSSGRVGDCSAC
jgi:hypothetical protein